jgi:hypothetical protein
MRSKDFAAGRTLRFEPISSPASRPIMAMKANMRGPKRLGVGPSRSFSVDILPPPLYGDHQLEILRSPKSEFPGFLFPL